MQPGDSRTMLEGPKISIEELFSIVRHSKLSVLRDSLDYLSTKPFDKINGVQVHIHLSLYCCDFYHLLLLTQIIYVWCLFVCLYRCNTLLTTGPCMPSRLIRFSSTSTKPMSMVIRCSVSRVKTVRLPFVLNYSRIIENPCHAFSSSFPASYPRKSKDRQVSRLQGCLYQSSKQERSDTRSLCHCLSIL